MKKLKVIDIVAGIAGISTSAGIAYWLYKINWWQEQWHKAVTQDLTTRERLLSGAICGTMTLLALLIYDNRKK